MSHRNKAFLSLTLSLLVLAGLTLPFVIWGKEKKSSKKDKSRSEKELDKREADYDRHARRAVPRDAFHVLFDPPMYTVKEGEKDGAVKNKDVVIGVEINGEAKAYPLAIMGFHELVNDTCGKKPIAVSW